jgi:hypothetical protein
MASKISPSVTISQRQIILPYDGFSLISFLLSSLLKCCGFRIPFLGTISDFLQTKTGFISCVILPLALFFVYQLYEFIMLLFEYKEIK